MERLYRVARAEEVFYAVERDGTLTRAITSGRTIFDGYAPGPVVEGGLGSTTVLAPVVPGKLVCVGLNYRDHAAEMKKAIPPEPMLFLKPSTATLDPGAPILLPPGVGTVQPDKMSVADFPALLAAWRERLSALAAEFLAGHAAVAPKRYPATCRWCALGSVCRVTELFDRGPVSIEDDGGDD